MRLLRAALFDKDAIASELGVPAIHLPEIDKIDMSNFDTEEYALIDKDTKEIICIGDGYHTHIWGIMDGVLAGFDYLKIYYEVYDIKMWTGDLSKYE